MKAKPPDFDGSSGKANSHPPVNGEGEGGDKICVGSADVGVSTAAWGSWEEGKRFPSVGSGVIATGSTANNTGIWVSASGSLALVARVGDVAPDAAGAVSGSSPVFGTSPQFVLPEQGASLSLRR